MQKEREKQKRDIHFECEKTGYRRAPVSVSHRCFPLLCVSINRDGGGCASHIRTVRSSEHDANTRGSRGFHATELTLPAP